MSFARFYFNKHANNCPEHFYLNVSENREKK